MWNKSFYYLFENWSLSASKLLAESVIDFVPYGASYYLVGLSQVLA